MNSARSVKDFVKLAWSILVPFKGFSLLSGSRSDEHYINYGVFYVISAVFIPALVFIASRLSIGVVCLRGAGLTIVGAAGKPTVLSRTKVGH